MLASALIGTLIFLLPLALSASLFPAGSSFSWDMWIQQKPVASRLLAQRNLESSSGQAKRFLLDHGILAQDIQPTDTAIEDACKYDFELHRCPSYIASERLNIVASDYRAFAGISNDVIRARDRHPDWSSSFPPIPASWLVMLALLGTLVAVVSSAYVLAAAEIGRTYSATLPPNLDEASNKASEMPKFMSAGFISVQTVALGFVALFILCYMKTDALAARTAFLALGGAEIVLLAYWLVRTAGYWSDLFLKCAYVAYWTVIAGLTTGFFIALRSV